MPRRGSERSVRYSSDESSSEDDRRHRRRRPRQRDRSPSQASCTTRQSRYSGRARSERTETDAAKSENLGKASIAIGFFSVIAGLLQLWTVKKSAEREREVKRERRKEFERTKAARRKDEAKRERQRGWDVEHSPPSEVRRIGNGYARSPSPAKAMMKIEAPPQDSARPSRRSSPGGRNYDYDRDYDNDRRSRRG
ncbi:hypothetical protein LTR08_005083 [Meristemomyces frigidus]|nr:hypothetical protein LTR08_005083 [Meristemomyces frigidus]